MTSTTYIRGRLAWWCEATETWRWQDTDAPAAGWGGEERPCPQCGALADAGGPDPCMGVLPGVSAACCGHGRLDGYVRLVDGASFETRLGRID